MTLSAFVLNDFAFPNKEFLAKKNQFENNFFQIPHLLFETSIWNFLAGNIYKTIVID